MCSNKTNLLLAGLMNVLYIRLKGLNKNVLPQLASPMIGMLWFLPLPFSMRFLTASAKTKQCVLLFLRICLASCSHNLLHPEIHSSLWQLARTCIQFCSALFTNAGALTSFHAFEINSLYTRSGVFAMKDLVHSYLLQLTSVQVQAAACLIWYPSLSQYPSAPF